MKTQKKGKYPICELFGQVVREIREKMPRQAKRGRGSDYMSQDEFAFLAQINRSYYSGVERGERVPSILQIERIAKTAQMEEWEIFKKVSDLRKRKKD